MNRQNTVDPVSELFERVSISFKKRELSLLLIVGVIGCIGTMSIFKRAFVKNPAAPKNLATINIPEKSNSQILLSKIDPFLNIQGDFQSEKPMIFSISNHNPKATYDVDFGDGKVMKGCANKFSHVYKKGGEYDVELIIHYKDESNSIFNTNLQIVTSDKAYLSSL